MITENIYTEVNVKNKHCVPLDNRLLYDTVNDHTVAIVPVLLELMLIWM